MLHWEKTSRIAVCRDTDLTLRHLPVMGRGRLSTSIQAQHYNIMKLQEYSVKSATTDNCIDLIGHSQSSVVGLDGTEQPTQQ